MLRKLRPRSIYDVMAAIACFGVLAGGTAYAANEWTGTNIVNSSLTGQDIFSNSVPGGDITNNSVTRDDVQNGSLTGVDLANLTVRGNNIGFNTIDAGHILDGSLAQEDISEGRLVDFSVFFGSIAAHDCAIQPVDGLNAQGDHLLLTPNTTTGGGRIVYSATYDSTSDLAWVTGCNTWTNAIAPGNVRFNLLVIEAQ